MPSDTSVSGTLNATLTMFNPAGTTAVDLHGAIGSGVNGAATGIRAMDFTPDLTPTQTNQPANSNPNTLNSAGNAVVAFDGNDATLATLNGGILTNFVATVWFKLNATMLNGATVGPRIWILNAGTAGVDSGGSANTLGLKFQQNNQLAFQMGTDNPTFLGTSPSGIFPGAKWLFFAIVYDGTNVSMYYGSDSAVSQLIGSATTAGRTINLGSAACLAIGNRHNATANARGLDGWVNDFRFYSGGVPANALTFVENIRKSIAPKIPTITGIYPDGTALLQGTNTLSFTASSSSGLNLTNIHVVLNGLDVSSSCTFVTNGTAGTSTNVSGSYAGLPQQTISTAVMSATDSLGLVGSASVTFDTFATNNFIFEAEEFDYGSGQFIDNPSYTDGFTMNEATSYFGLDSVEAVDTHKGASTGGNATDYRYDDGTGTRPQTPATVGEKPWFKFNNLVDTNGTAIVGHMIANWSSAEWQNYTKTFPSGQYNVYARASTASGSTITFDQVTSGRGTTSQTTTNLGSFTFSGTSLANFQWVPLRDSFGQVAIVNLAGVNTVRATTGGGADADFFMLVPANLNVPFLSGVYPNGRVLFQSTNRLVFTVSSQVANINTANIHLSLNGTDVSSNLVFTGGPSTWNVSFTGLRVSQTYAAVITVTDNNGGVGGGSFTFDTWNPLYQLEAEDFDFEPGQSPIPNGTGNRFIDNPVPTKPGVPAANSYEGQVGTQGVDESGITAGQSSANYRPTDQVATSRVTDASRQQFLDAGAFDYNVGFLGPGFWQDYTRTWPSGTYNVIARLASGANLGTLHASWSKVIYGAGTASQIARHIGTFSIPSSGGYSSYLYSPLIDRFGNYEQLTLSGAVETYRVTELTLDQSDQAAVGTFGLNANFYMLTAPRTDVPRVDSVYPDGSVLMQRTNRFSFVASSPTYGINTSNIQVVLNGVNISSSLVFSGSSPSWNVSYAGLQPSTAYTAVITVTDNTNQVHTTTVNFDTFDPNAFTWEAEDWDFDPSLSQIPNGSGLRYIDNPAPTSSAATNSYFNQISDLGIDIASVFGNAHPGTYVYRPSDNVATEVTLDAARQKYLNAQLNTPDPNIHDYSVYFWTNTGWINWTRTFPTGSYFIYGRLAGGNGPFNLQCSQVTSGFGTMSQTTSYLGTFRGTGTSFATYQWVPMINTNNSQPVAISFSGLTTLQMTADGNEDANFFLLVPNILPVSISASISGPNILLSFPTQNGFTYSVYFKNNITDATWNFLTSVPGDGTVKTVSDASNLTKRFYRLSIQ